jgi:hypothetical protein
MTDSPVRDIGPERPTVGPPSLTQGVYGARGNLELVVADPIDGLWVYWFNADEADDPGDPVVPRGDWSEGLRVAAGTRYTAGVLLQGELGPDHLELLALTAAGDVESWWWSPGPGFQRRPGTVVRGVALVARTRPGGMVEADVRGADGSWRRVASGPDGYPQRDWVSVGPVPGSEPDPDVATTVSTRRGGTLETVRRGPDGRLRHEAEPVD